MSRRALICGRARRDRQLALGAPLRSPRNRPAFAHWVADFRARAIRRGISEATYDRVMSALTPDTSVFEQLRAQPEFTEAVWQYINRRCSDWRVITGKERAKEYADLLARMEKDYGVDRYIMLGLWGMESSFGDVIVNPKYMRPVIPALAALAWRRAAPARLLGSRIAQRADHRRSRLGASLRHDRLLGRRHGSHPVDAGGLAASWASITTATAASRRSASPTIRWPAPRAIWSSAANTGAAKPGAAR